MDVLVRHYAVAALVGLGIEVLCLIAITVLKASAHFEIFPLALDFAALSIGAAACFRSLGYFDSHLFDAAIHPLVPFRENIVAVVPLVAALGAALCYRFHEKPFWKRNAQRQTQRDDPAKALLMLVEIPALACGSMALLFVLTIVGRCCQSLLNGHI